MRCSENFNLICSAKWALSIFGPPTDQSGRFVANEINQFCKPWYKTGYEFLEKVSLLSLIVRYFQKFMGHET